MVMKGKVFMRLTVLKENNTIVFEVLILLIKYPWIFEALVKNKDVGL